MGAAAAEAAGCRDGTRSVQVRDRAALCRLGTGRLFLESKSPILAVRMGLGLVVLFLNDPSECSHLQIFLRSLASGSLSRRGNLQYTQLKINI